MVCNKELGLVTSVLNTEAQLITSKYLNFSPVLRFFYDRVITSASNLFQSFFYASKYLSNKETQ